MEELSTPDYINLAIAFGTLLAAFGSWKAASIAGKSARSTARFAYITATEEKDRWLTELLFSLANQCNECVTANGFIKNDVAFLSRIVTILNNAIDMIHRQKPSDQREDHFKNLWIFLHSSIWVELKSRDVLNRLAPDPNGAFEFDGAEKEHTTLVEQYDKILKELIPHV